MRSLCWLLILATSLPCTPLRAQADSARARAKPPAMITGGDLLRLAAVGAISGLAYQIDGAVRDGTRQDPASRNDALDVLEQAGDILGYGGAIGAGGVMWIGGMMADNETVAVTGLRALEAIFTAGVVAKTIKGIAGRSRPQFAPHDPGDFEFGRGFGELDGEHESFPSGHATIVFAFASAVTGEVARRAPEHTRAVAITTYGLGVLTAYSRLSADEHWLSDLTLGAGIGMVTGWAVTRWHATRPDNRVDEFFLRPMVSRGSDGRARLGVVIETR